MMSEITLEKLLEAQQVKTADPNLLVTMPGKKLPVGQHRFSLTVADDSGNTSTPAMITVIVIDTEAPTAVLDLKDEQGRTISNSRVNFGAGFVLDGGRSSDIGGKITSYLFEVMPL